MSNIEIIATSEDKGQRLDKFLLEKAAHFISPISRSRIQHLIEQGMVINLSNNNPFDNSAAKIKGDEKILIKLPQLKDSEIKPQKIDFGIVFEDDQMLVINKPSGLITHPGNGRHDKTLVNALLYEIGDSLSGINGVTRPGIVHRLDKDTSGLMVVAKTDLAHQNLAQQLSNRSLKRTYLALCYGTPNPSKGTIDKNIERSRKNRLKMTVVKNGGKRAITHYEVIKTYCGGLLSLVKCQLETGRTHQIRVHLNEIGHSLIGDQIYSNKRYFLGNLGKETEDLINNFPRQFLHSYQIAFIHPKSAQEMFFEIDFPQDLKDLITKLSDINNSSNS